MPSPQARQIDEGVYLVEHDGRIEIVYVTGPPAAAWAFWNGHVFHQASSAKPSETRSAPKPASGVSQSVSSPMPATVLKVLVQPGTAVRKGDTIVVLEAMKMELPVRAPADAIVTAVHCREGQLVQPDASLVDFK